MCYHLIKPVCSQRPGRLCETTETKCLLLFAFVIMRDSSVPLLFSWNDGKAFSIPNKSENTNALVARVATSRRSPVSATFVSTSFFFTTSVFFGKTFFFGTALFLAQLFLFCTTFCFPWYLVTLSQGYLVTLFPCSLVALLPCSSVILIVTLFPCYPVTLFSCYSCCCLVTLLPC